MVFNIVNVKQTTIRQIKPKPNLIELLLVSYNNIRVFNFYLYLLSWIINAIDNLHRPTWRLKKTMYEIRKTS